MNLIEAYLPVYASAKFFIKKPLDWDKWSQKKKFEYFIENCETNAYLCHQCSGPLETDFEWDTLHMKAKDIEFYEGKGI